MPRPLVYGNGELLIAFDHKHQARDLCWPQVGYPNHLLGNRMRVGVWCDGEFSWCDSDDWVIEQAYKRGTLVGESVWRSWKLGLEMEVEEAIHPVKPQFTRKFLCRDLRGSQRNLRVFFTQRFDIGQCDVGNTAFYHPGTDSIVHYRGDTAIRVSARSGCSGVFEYATGITGFEGLEGTWRDAEDGVLGGNPIAQGSVDSTFSVDGKLAGQGTFAVEYQLVVGHSVDDVISMRLEADVTDASTNNTTKWLDGITPVPDEFESLFTQSLLFIRTQIDQGGAILAANDSDILATNRATYSYCWPRDGALVSVTLSRLGKADYAERFVKFCDQMVSVERPFLLQKYRSDGHVGAGWHPWTYDGVGETPFQEDETALTLLALRSCSEAPQKELWESSGRLMANFLLSHRDEQGLPLPSYDLWEERRGVHFFTVCAVVSALRASTVVSGESKYEEAADQMVDAAESAFFSETLGRYVRMIGDETPDSALIGGILLNDLSTWTHEEATVEKTRTDLTVDSEVGGLARYGGDYYFRQSDKFPGSPWIIATMWLARYYCRLGKTYEARELLLWVTRRAESTGVLAEQYHPETGEPLSVSPLTWSHAEFVEAVLDYVCALQK